VKNPLVVELGRLAAAVVDLGLRQVLQSCSVAVESGAWQSYRTTQLWGDNIGKIAVSAQDVTQEAH